LTGDVLGVYDGRVVTLRVLVRVGAWGRSV
jgi:hypothetical protein